MRSFSASDDHGGGSKARCASSYDLCCERRNRAPPHGGGVRMRSFSASDDDGGGSKARCASSYDFCERRIFFLLRRGGR
jgi:hypothetical protein